ncbi:hypothetical protein [Actinoplanes sp. NPDC048796]|uniref:hypothetical protein n=1 Tax=Actinoplanes sp. NPDC048796 TaxID=3155640 RepID=UPI00340C7115
MAAGRDQVRTPGALTRGPRPAWQRAGLAVAAVALGVSGAGVFLADTYATQSTCDEISGIGLAGEGYDSVKANFARHASLLLLHSDLRHAVRGLAADERRRQTLAAREVTAETVQAGLTVDDNIESRARTAQASCNLPVVGVLFPGEEASLAASITPIVAIPSASAPAGAAPATPPPAGSSSTGSSSTGTNPGGRSAADSAGGSLSTGSSPGSTRNNAPSSNPGAGRATSPSSKPGAGHSTAPTATPSAGRSPGPSPAPADGRTGAPSAAQTPYKATPTEIAQSQARVAEAAAVYRRLVVSPTATLAQRDVALYELAAAQTHLADLKAGNPNARHPKLELWGADAYLSAAIAGYRALLADPAATVADKTRAVAVVDYWQDRFDTLKGALTS